MTTDSPSDATTHEDIGGHLDSHGPGQWTKNPAVFAPIVFAQKVFDVVRLGQALEAFMLFCAASSCIYMVNDLFDRTQDRSHPVKGRRPIASGALSPAIAVAAVVIIHQKEEGGSPSSLLLNGRPLLINILLWAATAVAVLYPAVW